MQIRSEAHLEVLESFEARIYFAASLLMVKRQDGEDTRSLWMTRPSFARLQGTIYRKFPLAEQFTSKVVHTL